jgi:hypothetical protein
MGAAVAQLMKPSLSMRQRITQWTVGVCVAHFLTNGLAVLWGWPEMLADTVGFCIALVAYEATPKVVTAVGATIETLPSLARELPGRLVDGLVAKWSPPAAPGAAPEPDAPADGDEPLA